MAFASVESINPGADSATGGAATSGNSAAASHAVVLPSTVSPGALLAIFGRVAVGTDAITIDGGGWTIIEDDTDASDDRAFWAYRNTLADGSEDGTSVTVNHTNSKMCAVSMSIIDAEDPATQAPEFSTVAIGNASATVDPTTCTPTGGAKDYLWLWFGSWSGEQTLSKTQPTDFTDRADVSSGTGGTPTTNVQAKVCDRQLNASSLDPGTVTLSVSSPGWTAWTIAIHPATAPTPTATTVARLSLASASEPATRTLHKIMLRARKASGTGTVLAYAALYEGGTNRSGDLATTALTTSFADYELAVPDAGAANITSYANLELRVWAECDDGDTVDVDVAEVSLSIPAAAGDVTEAGTLTAVVALASVEKVVEPGAPLPAAVVLDDVEKVAEPGAALVAAVVLSGVESQALAETGSPLVATVALDDVEKVAEPGAPLVASVALSGVETSVEPAAPLAASVVLSGTERVAESVQVAAVVVLSGDEQTSSGDVTESGTLVAAVVLDDVERLAESVQVAVAVVLDDVERLVETGAQLVAVVVLAGDEQTSAGDAIESGTLVAVAAFASVETPRETGSPLPTVVALDDVERVSEPGGILASSNVLSGAEAYGEGPTLEAVALPVSGHETAAEDGLLVAVVVLFGFEPNVVSLVGTATPRSRIATTTVRSRSAGSATIP